MGDSQFHAVLQTIRKRRSVRLYQSRPPDRDTLNLLFEAARWAPSNWNSQPWRFVVSDDPQTNARISGVLRERAEQALDRSGGKPAMRKVIEHCVSYFYAVEQSPVIVAVCYKPFSHSVDREVAVALEDGDSLAAWNPNVIGLGMACQNLLLAAHALGLGACFHSGPIPFLRRALHGLLDLHPRLELAGLITVGWPRDGFPGAPRHAAQRKDLSRIVKFAGPAEPPRDDLGN